jgi:3-methyladenine DNA glycosylase AlkD
LKPVSHSAIHPFVVAIKKVFDANRNPERSVPMKAYMRDQFEFVGIPSPARRELMKEFFRSNTLPEKKSLETVIRQLWNLPERDYQYFGIELAMKYKKQWAFEDIKLFEFMILNKSWWDTVDYISSKLIGPLLLKYPDSMATVTAKWNRSKNFWLQRLSLIFQLTYGTKTDPELLEKYIQALMGSNEFFVQKAIGWSLRQYSKYDPKWVKSIITKHPLSNLSKREALKVIVRKS